MLRVGVTGGIGSGKTTVCEVLAVLGAPVFHADDEARQVQDDDPEVRRRMVDAFGEKFFENGALNRKALAERVFGDPDALRRLNEIVHPAVRERFKRFCVQHAREPYVVMEAAILVETGGHKALDHLVVVTAPEDERVRRVMGRDGADAAHVRARIRHQATDAQRKAVADTLIVNDGRTLVIPQVLSLHERLMGRT
ncbi:MAG: dephospho-CoA kinase [Flavobacteriales bacterium]|nr:dephospho-CoA kinase [Flavobacteriales bacterium]